MMRRTTPRQLMAMAAVLIVGVGLGVGGTTAAALLTDDNKNVAVSGYEVSHGRFGSEITVWVTSNRHPTFTLWVVEEKADRVEVSVRERVSGMRTLEAVPYRLVWLLASPLGSRTVVDMSSGRSVAPMS